MKSISLSLNISFISFARINSFALLAYTELFIFFESFILYPKFSKFLSAFLKRLTFNSSFAPFDGAGTPIISPFLINLG